MTRMRGLYFCLKSFFVCSMGVGGCLALGCGTQQSPPKPLVTASSDKAVLGNEGIEDFRRAKKHVYALFKDRLRTFYCDCSYLQKTIDSKRCSFKSGLHLKRAKRTEIEHVVPVHAFGQSFEAWRNGHPRCVDKKGRRFKGRRCVSLVSPRFKRMSSDLYNLRPTVGAVNALRSNFRMGVIQGEKRQFGTCDMEIEQRVFEPRPSIRGDIARIYFYMDAAYSDHGIVGKKQLKLLKAWHRADPVSEEERALGVKIQAIQGNENPFVTSNLQPM
jgi:deoxyribonuclease I